MSLSHNLRSVALALVLALPMAAPLAPPAEAALIQGPARTGAGSPELAWQAAHATMLPAGVAGLRIAASQKEDCADCLEVASSGLGRRGSTLSVNLAILVLGTLWVGLMLRRIQVRSALDDLRDAGPRHAAGGH